MRVALQDKDITSWSSKDKDGGQFKRQQSSFRDTISKDGKFPPEKGRYHLVVSLACPWAHRALITRKLKGLEEILRASSLVRFLRSRLTDQLSCICGTSAHEHEGVDIFW